MLRARERSDQLRLEWLTGDSLPGSGAVPASGSTMLRRTSGLLPLVVCVKPFDAPKTDFGARHVGAPVLIVEPGRTHRVDAGLVAATFGLTPAESRVAVRLAERVRDIAKAMQHTTASVYWHLEQIYQKLLISGQADLVWLVLSVAEFG